MTGAIEFLTKAKAMEHPDEKREVVDMIISYIWGDGENNPAGLVRKVMAYQIKEDTK